MDMFCKFCGVEIADDSKVCSSCGKPLEDPNVLKDTLTSVNTAINKANTAFEGTTADDLAFKVNDKSVKLATVIKSIALLISILFFFPMFTVSCSSEKVSFSGLNALTGLKKVKGEKLDFNGNFFALFVLLIPVLLIVFFYVKDKIKQAQNRTFMISAGIATVGFIYQLIFKAAVNSSVNKQTEGFGTTKFTFGYHFMNILYIILIAISVIGMLKAEKKSDLQS